MKKVILLVGSLAVCLFVLAGCSCKHVWTDPDCTTAKTCSECQTVEGEPLGHTWENATCEVPRTCTSCASTEGDALGHSWVDATCETPKTCTACAAMEGELLPHSFEISEYTVTDGTPIQTSTCHICGFQETLEGEALVSNILSGGVWGFLAARFDGEQIDFPEVCYVIFGDQNTFTFVLGDKFKMTGTWTLYQSSAERGSVTHSLLFYFQDGSILSTLQYTDPDVLREVLVIRDSQKNYFSFVKIDFPETP